MTMTLLLQAAGMFIIPLAFVIVPLLMGERYGIYRSKVKDDISYDSISSVVSAAFGLLAFMLGFTFQIASNRFDSRKALLLEEAQGIRTAYLRAGLIPEPYCSGTKTQLLEYIDLRLDVSKDQSKLYEALARSQVILDSLWRYTEALAAQDRSSEVYALYTTAINDMVDTYNERITMALVYRIPSLVLWVLYILVFLSMLVLGYQFGLSGKGSFKINLLLAIIFAVVMFLIFALDRPNAEVIKLNQQPLLTLQAQMKASNIMQK